MQPHVKIYTDYFKLGIDSIVECEVCKRQGNINNFFDIHHVFGRVGKNSNDIYNLMLLCRDCHNKAHSGELSKVYLFEKHKNNLE